MIGLSTGVRRGRRSHEPACLFVVLACVACGEPAGPELEFDFQTAEAWLERTSEEGMTHYRSSGSIFPPDWTLSLDDLPGIEAHGGESSIRIRGLYVVSCIGLGAEASVAASGDRLVLTIQRGEGTSCAFAFDPNVFRADIMDLEPGTYGVEVVYDGLIVDQTGRIAEGATVFRSEVNVG